LNRKTLKAQLESFLYPETQEVPFILLVGPRACGKTSLVCDLPDRVGYHYFFVSFEAHRKGQNIWSFLYDLISPRFSRLGVTLHSRWTEGSELNFFKITKQLNIIFILDELDTVFELPKDERDSFLGTFRHVKHRPHEFGLRGVIGVFTLFQLNKLKSPWNIQQLIHMNYFTLAQTQSLFAQFTSQYHVTVSDNVVQYLFEYTSGYPGLWSICAAALLDYVSSRDRSILVFDEHHFLELKKSGRLLNNLQHSSSTRRIIEEFHKEKNCKVLQQHFWNLFLKHENRQFIMDPFDDETVFFSKHALIIPKSIQEHTWIIGCEALRTLFLLRYHDLPKPLQVQPWRGQKLDLVKVLEHMAPCFDFSQLRNAYDIATRRSEIPRITGKPKLVLKKAVYSLAFVSVLKHWFADCVIYPGANCDKKETDILISSLNPPSCVVIELVANERFTGEGTKRRSTMVGHCEKTFHYAKSVKADDSWLVHFVGVDAFPSTHEFPDPLLCSCVYLYHLHDWSMIRAHSKETNGEQRTFTLKLSITDTERQQFVQSLEYREHKEKKRYCEQKAQNREKKNQNKQKNKSEAETETPTTEKKRREEEESSSKKRKKSDSKKTEKDKKPKNETDKDKKSKKK